MVVGESDVLYVTVGVMYSNGMGVMCKEWEWLSGGSQWQSVGGSGHARGIGARRVVVFVVEWWQSVVWPIVSGWEGVVMFVGWE